MQSEISFALALKPCQQALVLNELPSTALTAVLSSGLAIFQDNAVDAVVIRASPIRAHLAQLNGGLPDGAYVFRPGVYAECDGGQQQVRCRISLTICSSKFKGRGVSIAFANLSERGGSAAFQNRH